MSKSRKNNTPFKVGDRVIAKHNPERGVLTVNWVCKGDYQRDEQLIATEYNGYCHPASHASLYELAQ